MKKLKRFTVLLLILLGLIGAFLYFYEKMPPDYDTPTQAQRKILDYAQANGLSYSDYPKSLIALLERNPETEQFVLEYPTASKQTAAVDLSDYGSFETVPLFLQWDQQWGYLKYGSDMAGITGCGPVCLSMAACYLTKDAAFAPDKIIQFANENGYYVSGSGSSWKLISEGAEKLGLISTELPLDENRMVSELNAGNPVICVMGPGDFTTTGHFIILTGYENGYFHLNDSNSQANSQKLWTYEQLKGQIRNLWAIQN